MATDIGSGLKALNVLLKWSFHFPFLDYYDDQYSQQGSDFWLWTKT